MYLFSVYIYEYIYIYISLGRPRRRWEDNIRMGHKEIGINARNWVASAQDRCYSRTHVNGSFFTLIYFIAAMSICYIPWYFAI